MSEAAIFQSKPSQIEAIQWNGENFPELVKWGEGKVQFIPRPLTSDKVQEPMRLFAGKDGAQEWVPVPIGHWLVCQPGDKSDIWPVDANYFARKYAPAGERSEPPQLTQIREWVAGTLFPDHDTFSMGRQYAEALLAHLDAQSEAERSFLAASITVWRHIDRYEAGDEALRESLLDQGGDLRTAERAAWRRYRDQLDQAS